MRNNAASSYLKADSLKMELKQLHEFVEQFETMDKARKIVTENPQVDTHPDLNLDRIYNILKSKVETETLKTAANNRIFMNFKSEN